MMIRKKTIRKKTIRKKVKPLSKNRVDRVNAKIAVNGITRKSIAIGIARSYNTVCLVLRRKRHSHNILNQIEGYVRSYEKKHTKV